MIYVYIWNFQGKNIAWGHASMNVNGTYISWWPEKKEDRHYSKISQDIYFVHSIRGRTFPDDKWAEGNYKYYKSPDHLIAINGLDETKILQWWGRTALIYNNQKYQGPIHLPWSTLGWNCAKIVATALKEGGGDKYSDFINSRNLIWTPNDVKGYAQSISINLQKNTKS